MVDKAGNEVTPEQVAAQTTFTRVANVDDDTVYIRADGSGVGKNKDYTQDDLAYVNEKPMLLHKITSIHHYPLSELQHAKTMLPLRDALLLLGTTSQMK